MNQQEAFDHITKNWDRLKKEGKLSAYIKRYFQVFHTQHTQSHSPTRVEPKLSPVKPKEEPTDPLLIFDGKL